MVNIIQKSFSLNLKVLNIMGLYAYGNSSIFLKVRAYTLYFILLVLTTILIIIKILTSKNSNDLETNVMLTYVTDCVSFFFKLLPFLQNSEKIKQCINFFGQKNFTPKTHQQRKIIEECIWVCRRNSIVYFTGVLLAIIGWNFPVLFVKGRKLPLRLWLPYDPSSTTVNYYFTLVYIAAATVYVGYSGTIMDTLIGGLAYHATAQLKILKYNLKHLDKHLEDKLNKSKFSCSNKHLESCINHHKNILWFIDEYEECFSWSIFCQFAGSMFAVCFCYISLTLVPLNSVEAITYFVLIFNLSFQILFYCHYGTLLYEENNDLINAIYMGPWYKYNVEIRKNLLIIMERSKRPLLITAGKVVDVTVRTFVSVLKTSYSLIAVFNNYN
ncbi:hypothetical protein Zmor_010315 [Zophobas morio]|uniref:Odorant receptor n=1 Tax=Zophobas morio TaxID=2755281 RepID=A0AA38MJL9_9CUCU|nr:hypothetical protein Zmor_010315 [Zophobas morio]